MSSNMQQAIELRSKCEHFRILVIGVANSGKTTLLKRVCSSTIDPEIFSPSGEKLDPSVVQETSERGEHDIENELIFSSNPNFIFHDSRGFEAGSEKEVDAMKAFITKRSQTRELPEQLHAIWYCIPLDTKRPLPVMDIQFFDEYGKGRGRVPVVAIFTKFDGLETMAFSKLRDQDKLTIKDARIKKHEEAQEMLSEKYIQPLEGKASDYVQLAAKFHEQKEDIIKSKCTELIEKTTNALDDDTLKLLLVSVQQNNINISIRYAVQYSGYDKSITVERLVQNWLAWFEHIWRSYENYEKDNKDEVLVVLEKLKEAETASCNALEKHALIQHPTDSLSVSDNCELMAAVLICTKHTFFMSESAQAQTFEEAFPAALDIYMKNTIRDDVNRDVKKWLEEIDFQHDYESRGKLANIIQNHNLPL